MPQTLSVLLNVSDLADPAVGGSSTQSFREKGEYIDLLGSLGRAVAVGAEAGENLDDISAGSLGLKVSCDSHRGQVALGGSDDVGIDRGFETKSTVFTCFMRSP